MANTDKQNFRWGDDRWRLAQEKAADMRRRGYDIDMTIVLVAAGEQFLSETPEQTAKRLNIERTDGPVPMYRRRYPRAAG